MQRVLTIQAKCNDAALEDEKQLTNVAEKCMAQ